MIHRFKKTSRPLVVGHCCLNFLPTAHSGYYDNICYFRRYKPVILAGTRTNEHLFPFTPVFVASSEANSEDTAESIQFEAFVELVRVALAPEPIQLLQAHGGPAGIAFLAASLTNGLPLVTAFTGHDIPALSHHSYSHSYLLTLRLLFETGTFFTVLSEEMRDRAIGHGCPAEKIRVVRRGIDLAQFPFRPRNLSSPRQPTIFLCASRLSATKGFDDLLTAFAGIVREGNNVRLRILGDGELREDIETQIIELGIADYVEMLGWQSREAVAQQMASCHIFCLPACTTPDGEAEGMPTVLKEAMASGMPVISTYHGGIPELIADGVNGFLVPEHDVEALQDRMQYLLNHPECWTEMGRSGRAEVEARHDISKHADCVERIYDEVLSL